LIERRPLEDAGDKPAEQRQTGDTKKDP